MMWVAMVASALGACVATLAFEEWRAWRRQRHVDRLRERIERGELRLSIEGPTSIAELHEIGGQPGVFFALLEVGEGDAMRVVSLYINTTVRAQDAEE